MFEIENFDEFGKQNKNQNGEYQYVKVRISVMTHEL